MKARQSKFWYEVQSETGFIATFHGKSGKKIARDTAKELSAGGREAWINGFDVAEEWSDGKLKQTFTAKQYDFEEAKTDMLRSFSFCPPEPLFHKLASKFFEPRCPYFETGEREMMLDEIARYLGFEGYPMNFERSDEFMQSFTEKLIPVIRVEKWHIRPDPQAE